MTAAQAMRVPNAETQAAMCDARDGKVERFDSVAELMSALNEDDEDRADAPNASRL